MRETRTGRRPAATHIAILTPLTDKDVLIILYCATDGANWTNKGNWLSAMALDSWDGVTATNNTVTGLNLDFNQLSGTIPTELGELGSLTGLDFGLNELSGTIPTELGALTSLTVLSLYENQLSGTIPTELGDSDQPDGTRSQ